MDSQPDFESLDAFRWLDELPDGFLRQSMKAGLAESVQAAAFRKPVVTIQFVQKIAVFLVRWGRSQKWIIDNQRLLRCPSITWESVRRMMRRSAFIPGFIAAKDFVKTCFNLSAENRYAIA